MTYLGDADDHVRNVRFEGVHSAGLLVAAKPDANTDVGTAALLVILLHELDLASNMGEVLGHAALGTRDSNFPSVHFRLHCAKRKETDYARREVNLPSSGI